MAPLVVTIDDQNGTQATATGTQTGGVVTAVTITNAGTGYTSVPDVTVAGDSTGGCGRVGSGRGDAVPELTQ